MNTAFKCLAAILISFPLVAQTPPGLDKNAALRYWTAFALATDIKVDEAESRQLEAIADGEAPWDESAFGNFVQVSGPAVETMVRGTSLPYCAWGVDYKLGPTAPIPQVAAGRVLARLNVITAQRLAARGDSRGATRHLVAGIRFAEDLSKGMPLIGALTGKLALTADLKAASALARSGKLSSEDKLALAASVRTLPPDVFDWSETIRIELQGVRNGLVQLKKSNDPQAVLREWGEDPSSFGDNVRPTDGDLQQFDSVMRQAVWLFGLPASQVDNRLTALDSAVQTLGPLISRVVPSLRKANESRKQVEKVRQDFLATMGK